MSEKVGLYSILVNLLLVISRLYKVENFVSLISSLFIFLAGYEIVKTVFVQQSDLKTEYLPYAIGGVLLSIGITFVFSRYELTKGKMIGSPSLMADAQHIRTDMFFLMRGLM